jgi:predicted flavoprotein YhiN
MNFIFATGGTTHRETGSTGDGFNWLRKIGHTVVDPTPSIVPLAVADTWVKKLAGITLEEMKITFFTDGVKAFSKKGRLLYSLILACRGRSY